MSKVKPTVMNHLTRHPIPKEQGTKTKTHQEIVDEQTKWWTEDTKLPTMNGNVLLVCNSEEEGRILVDVGEVENKTVADTVDCNEEKVEEEEDEKECFLL